MSLLMVLVIAVTVGILFICIAILEERRDKRLYALTIKIMSTQLERPCENRARDLEEPRKNKKEV